MKLTIYNGSPRGKNSNTKILLDKFIRGYYSQEKYDINEFYLAARSQRIAGAKAFRESEVILLAFPLYTDSMPGIVKEFIELLGEYTAQAENPKMAFLVQSGFPEPAHSRYIERYLARLCERMHAEYLGTVVKGGVEGIKIMPPWMTRKLYRRFYKLGRHFAIHNELDDRIIRKLAPHEHLTPFRLFIFKLMQRSRMANFYWNNQLKENGVYEQRFDRPYAQSR